MRIRLIGAVVAALATSIVTGAASAASPAGGACSGTPEDPGFVSSGTYSGYTVSGTCFFVPGATVTIDGNLTVAPGASLNAHDATPANVQVNGNVLVGRGGIVGLGAYYYGFGSLPPVVVVDGNIIANQPQSLYLSFVTVHGNLVSHGGSGPALNFPLKNLTVDGNVDLQGWSGQWIGLFRSTIGGNVIFSKNTGTQIGESGTPDSSEVADNTVGGNLICQGNDPGAQFGDSGGGPNSVGGVAIGQCAGLTTLGA